MDGHFSDQKEKDRKFQDLKTKRQNAFNTFFEKMRTTIEYVYQQLTKNVDDFGGKTLLYLENKTEPYNGGIIFNPTPPNKRFTYDSEYMYLQKVIEWWRENNGWSSSLFER